MIGKWWDRKGENEIDLIVVDPIQKEAWMYELKKQGYRYKEDEFREKVDKVLQQTPELRNMTLHIGSLSLDDMQCLRDLLYELKKQRNSGLAFTFAPLTTHPLTEASGACES